MPGTYASHAQTPPPHHAIYLSVHRTIYRSIRIYPSIRQSVYLSIPQPTGPPVDPLCNGWLALGSFQSLCACIFLCLSVCVAACLSLYLSPPSLSLSASLSLSVSVCLCSASASVSVSVCLCPSPSVSLSVSVSLSLSVSLSVSVCLCLSLSVSVCLCLSLSVSACLCLPACLPACLSVCLSAYHWCMVSLLCRRGWVGRLASKLYVVPTSRRWGELGGSVQSGAAAGGRGAAGSVCETFVMLASARNPGAGWRASGPPRSITPVCVGLELVSARVPLTGGNKGAQRSCASQPSCGRRCPRSCRRSRGRCGPLLCGPCFWSRRRFREHAKTRLLAWLHLRRLWSTFRPRFLSPACPHRFRGLGFGIGGPPLGSTGRVPSVVSAAGAGGF